MRNILGLSATLLIAACGITTPPPPTPAATPKAVIESNDSITASKAAVIMIRDLHDNILSRDLDHVAALAHEAETDINNLIHNGDTIGARAYTEVLTRYLINHSDVIGDMASENLTIKSLIYFITHLPNDYTTIPTDTIIRHLNSPINASAPTEDEAIAARDSYRQLPE